MPTHRRKPFSGKQKKLQLQQRNALKAEVQARQDSSPPPESTSVENVEKGDTIAPSLPGNARGLTSYFVKLTPKAIQQARLESMKPFQRKPKSALELGPDPEVIDFPKRPPWNYRMSKEQVEKQEEESFKQWEQEVVEKYSNITRVDGEERHLSWFERNLNVWRQLWRVLEISDVIMIIMDIRHPLLHFPQALYDYVARDPSRKLVGVLNKVDLVSEFTVYSWRKYFEEHYPELQIAVFSCYPRDEKLIDDTVPCALKTKVKRNRNRRFQEQGVKGILQACRDVKLEKKGAPVDWNEIIRRYSISMEEHDGTDDEHDDSDNELGIKPNTTTVESIDTALDQVLHISEEENKPNKDYITLGLVGYPNAGKSTIINSIMQKTVTSTSRTPGHTKHFQTIHLTENVRLCDSPGLIFPSLLPRALQILAGMYPIAQVQEPYSAIQYLAERVPLEKILSLPRLDSTPSSSAPNAWSAWDICEAYAEQRGFHTARAARPDTHRAANALLRLTNDGRILLSLKPPGFFTSTKYEQLRVQDADNNNT